MKKPMGKAKIMGDKDQIKMMKVQLRGVELYFEEYSLTKHFQDWIIARNNETDIPPYLIEDKTQFTELKNDGGES